MQLLEDILRVLGVAGREAEGIVSELCNLAGSRGARKLVVKLPRKEREKLDENLEAAVPEKQVEIIQNVIESNFSEQERRQAFEHALEEVIREEFLPTILEEATTAQQREIQKIVIGQ